MAPIKERTIAVPPKKKKSKKKNRSSKHNDATATTLKGMGTGMPLTETKESTATARVAVRTNEQKGKAVQSKMTLKNTKASPVQSSSSSVSAAAAAAISLASRLKRQRGTADTTPLPPPYHFPTQNNSDSTAPLPPLYLTPADAPHFQQCLETSYRGFVWHEKKNDDSDEHKHFHGAFDACFQDLEGLYLYDKVQAGGTRVTHTYCQRTLIGEPGSTYKYLGLRLFSHPWRITTTMPSTLHHDSHDETKNNNQHDNSSTTSNSSTEVNKMMQYGYTRQHAKALLQMGRLNQILIQKTRHELDKLHHQHQRDNDKKQQQQQQHSSSPNVNDYSKQKKNKDNNNNKSSSSSRSDILMGSCEYSLTLVNRMEPSSVKKDLKRDSQLKFKTSVSWHKDSGLQDFSSIAVYQSLGDGERAHSKPWSIALRVATPAGTAAKGTQSPTTPALVIPLPSNTVYYLLDDFNHQHEHAVLSGATQLRYSSTHRVARGATSWWNIQEQLKEHHCGGGGDNKKNKNTTTATATSDSHDDSSWPTVKRLRAQQALWTDLEFEWLRQWYIQGQDHADLHSYWHKPVKLMEESWQHLQDATETLILKLHQEKESVSTKDKGRSTSSTSTTMILTMLGLITVLLDAHQNRLALCQKWDERYLDPIYQTQTPVSNPIALSSATVLQTTISKLKPLERYWRKLQSSSSATTSTASTASKNANPKRGSNWLALSTTIRSSSSSKKLKKMRKK